ncbi:hypothetical protein [Streptomyces griseorubiginosus]|uniref:hypothetical protein n=1 Tax=Streptomyces griseorubiginosus TaxID=67304 RepID=UPI0033193E61
MVVRVRKRVGALGFEAALGRLVEDGLVRFSSFVLRKNGDHKAVVRLPAGLAAVVVADQAVTVHGALFGVEGEIMSAVRTATFQLAFPPDAARRWWSLSTEIFEAEEEFEPATLVSAGISFTAPTPATRNEGVGHRDRQPLRLTDTHLSPPRAHPTAAVRRTAPPRPR